MSLRQRRAWACPDLGVPKADGFELPIPGCKSAFPDCPKYYLRTAADGLPADHLIDGAIWPPSIVSADASELESGATRSKDLTPKRLDLARVWNREKADRTEWENSERDRKRRSGVA